MRYPGALIADVPANLNAMLLDGRLDLSPISAFHWAKYADQLALLPQLCIGARREVWSVVCVSAKPLAELNGADIAVTVESASGRNLLRVLLERRYGVVANFVESTDPFTAAANGQPALLIGDRAIDAQQTFAPGIVHDLGLEWNDWTQSDMVFAVWAVRRDTLARHPEQVDDAMRALVASQRWGSANMDAVVANAMATHARHAGYYDLSDLPAESLPLLADLDILILDALRREPHPTHSHLAKSIALVEQIKPRRAYFTHMSHDLDHAPTEAILPPTHPPSLRRPSTKLRHRTRFERTGSPTTLSS